MVSTPLRDHPTVGATNGCVLAAVCRTVDKIVKRNVWFVIEILDRNKLMRSPQPMDKARIAIDFGFGEDVAGVLVSETKSGKAVEVGNLARSRAY
jgi:hypothetical protein